MTIDRRAVVDLLGARNPWSVTGPVVYDLKVVDVDRALQDLRTCWPGHETFAEIARAIHQQSSGPATALAKVQAMAASGVHGPVLVPCFTHGALKRIWPAEYPPCSFPPDDALIVEDGNHRLTALALARERGQQLLMTHVGVFVARV